ncbi:pilus assembly PilX N-terminal domain-containing protein [Patescibacteria group bacterium]|nr:pilus assembly PilX N-terminal domain-containing protein [Patescibacteria group bacterium]
MIYKTRKQKNNKSLFSFMSSERQHLERPRNKGFVLLIAVLLASVFTLIGASIFTISVKELMLSSGGKESQYAFYAADSGLECALYWDLRHNPFATSTSSVEPSNIYCSDQDVTSLPEWDWNPISSTKGETSFSFDLYPDDSSRDDCAVIYVVKENVSPGIYTTQIESRGYNTCDVNNPRRVERAIRANY